jgi:urea transporter
MRLKEKTMSLDSSLDLFRNPIPGAEDNSVIRAVDWIFRGVGQVVFQSNWLSGILILVAIGVNSPVYLVAALLGTIVSTYTAVLFKMDRGLINAGLLGFNGTLAGIGINFYMSQNSTPGDWPNLQLYLLIVLASALSTVVLSTLASLLGTRSVPTLTAPFVFASWLMLFSVYSFTGFEPGELLGVRDVGPLTETASYTWETFFNGTFKGVGEIFFQDNALTGIIMAVGVFANTRIGGLMCVGGPAIAALVAMAAGADEGAINLGLYGFNASLTAIALGGFFFVFNGMGALYTLFGIVVTTFVWPAIGTVLAPIGMPTFTFPFVLTTWIFLLAKPGFAAIRAVAPADATYPEDNYRRWKANTLAAGY